MPLLKTLEGLSFRLFGKMAPAFLKNVFEFEGYLKKADMRIYPETYVSIMFLIALLTVPVSIVGILLLYFFQFLPFIFLVPVPLFVMIAFIIMPMSKASERSQRLEREMPFAATYVAVMASGGIPPYTSFKRLGEAQLLPAMSQEAKSLIRDVEIFGVDPLSAMQNAAKANPLDIYREFVGGYASTVIIGGDITSFLETKAGELFKTRAARVRAAAERLGMLLESFIIIMVLMSLCFYILFSVESIYSTGMSSYSGIIMYTFVFTPLLSFVFIYLAHGMQPKSPITDYRPYKVFGICLAIGGLVLAILTNFFGLMPIPILAPLSNLVDIPTAVSIALIISTAPAAIVQIKLSGEKGSTEKGVTLFLQDLTETRKTGLAPEKCIETLSDREYGYFSKHLKKITAELSWGIPLRKVFMDFVKRTKSWTTQIVMFLLVETVDVGGGTIAMIESLARFCTTTQEVEREKKMAVKPYIMMPYFAALMLVATTIMMLTFTTTTVNMADPTASTSQIDLEALMVIFSTSVIIHSYLIGLVGGKISEESVAAGFKHSALLTLIAIIAAKVAPSLISFGGG
ncbi:MAG: type II secretion system F family protein [Candidatus Bathyarchaeota archaeon]|nr:MAG: type II secretion system F family protein [Candidatus Bathyarchaeota archaeon]